MFTPLENCYERVMHYQPVETSVIRVNPWQRSSRGVSGPDETSLPSSSFSFFYKDIITMTNGEQTADETAPAAAEPKTKYQVMHVGVGKTYAGLHTALLELSDSLGCTPAPLVWLAIQGLLTNPPTVAPEGAQQRAGAASGFWVLPVTDANGRAESVRVVEVLSRGDVAGGQTFFRYDKDDENTRGRAERQALKAAQHLCQLLGIDPNTVTSERLQPVKA